MMKRLLVMITVFTMSNCFANNLTLVEAIDLASNNDRLWRIAEAKSLEAREYVPKAYAQLLPSVNLSVSSTQVTQQLTSGSLVNPEQSYPSQNKSINLRQPLVISKQLDSLRIARYQEEQAHHIKKEEFQQLLIRAVSQYLDVISEKNKYDLIVSQRKELETRYKAVLISNKVGQASQLDVEEITVQINILKSNEIRSERNFKLSLKQLENIVGINVESVSDLSLNLKKIEKEIFSLNSDYFDSNINLVPKYLSQLKEVDIAEMNMSLAQKGHLPSVDLIAQIGRSNGENSFFTNTKNENKFIGVQLNLSLFSGGAIESQVRTYIAKVEQAKENLEFTKDNLKILFRKEIDNLEYNLKLIKALDTALIASDQNISSNILGLKAGNKSILDLIKSENQRIEIRSNYVQTSNEIIKSMLRINGIFGANTKDKIINFFN